MVVPLFVGREKSIRAIQSVMGEGHGKTILLVTQRNPALDDPTTDDLYSVGTLGTVIQVLTLPDGTIKALIEGKGRMDILDWGSRADYFEASATPVVELPYDDTELEPLKRTLLSEFEQYVRITRKNPTDILNPVGQIHDTSKLVDTISAHVPLKIDMKQVLLEKNTLVKRLELLVSYIGTEMEMLQAERRIRSRIKNQVEKNQREYLLNEQLKAIQRELGETDESRDELSDIEDKIEKTKLWSALKIIFKLYFEKNLK
jgi:ATP-dependent Lon protease